MTTELQTDVRGGCSVQRMVGRHSWALLINEDCRDVREQIQADAIVSDPPYGVTDHEWDEVVPAAEWMLTKCAIVTASEPYATQLINSAPLPFKFDCVWVKGRASGALYAAAQPMRRHERVLVFGAIQYTQQKRKLKPHELARRDRKQREQYGDMATADTVLEYQSVQCQGILHPTQKPVDLFEHLVAAFTAGTVCDPFMGSGTTGVACARLHRNFIGIERDAAHYKTACDRIAHELDGALL